MENKKKPKLYSVKLVRPQIIDMIALLTNRVEAVNSNLGKERDVRRRLALGAVKQNSVEIVKALMKALPKKKNEN